MASPVIGIGRTSVATYAFKHARSRKLIWASATPSVLPVLDHCGVVGSTYSEPLLFCTNGKAWVE